MCCTYMVRHRVLQIVCSNFLKIDFFRMANVFGYLSDGLYEEEDVDTEPYGNGLVDFSSSETGNGDLGDDEEKDSSILESSSNPVPMLTDVPSVGPSFRHTAGSVPLDSDQYAY